MRSAGLRRKRRGRTADNNAGRIAACQYAAQRRLGFRWLRFAGPVEHEFREGFFAINAMRVRLAMSVAVFGIATFILLDRFAAERLMPDRAALVLAGVGIPFCLIAVAVTFMQTRPRLRQYVLWLAATAVCLGVVAAVVLCRRLHPAFPYEPVLMATVYVFFLSGLLYRQAIICGVVTAVAYLAGRAQLPDAGYSLQYEIYFLLLANSVGWIGLYFFEYHQRMSFLLERELGKRALLDGLTGTLNRVAMRKQLSQIWRQAQHERKSLALLWLDIDYFKGINDEFGHLVGDACLRAVADLLAACCSRPLDAVGRFGGDEFLATWYDVDPDWFDVLCADLSDRARGLRVHSAPELKLQISGGAVIAWPSPNCRLVDSLRLADTKLYEAKRSARGTILCEHINAPVRLHLVKGGEAA